MLTNKSSNNTCICDIGEAEKEKSEKLAGHESVY